MITTSLDVLYVSLAIGFIVLVIFFSIALFYLVFILRDVSKITDKAKDTTDTLSEYVLSPVKFIFGVYEKLEPIIENLIEKAKKK
jgi:hypothetical protein